jgi:excisionase family DNA binding protein
MAKLIPAEEAAQMLGLTVEQLREMLSRKEIFGYRDGASWKFKEEELKRVSAQLGSRHPSDMVTEAPVEGGTPIDEDLEKLVDVAELTSMDARASDSSQAGAGPREEDLSFDSELDLEPSGADVLNDSGELLAEDAGPDTANLGDAIAEAAEQLGGDSDELRLAPHEEATFGAGEPTGARHAASKTGDAEEEFTLSEEGLDLDSESDADLVIEDDDLEVAQQGEDQGLERAGKSDRGGISRDRPVTDLDSLSLDDLELGEDETISLDKEGGLDEASPRKADDDFLLTPVDEASGVDETDSGSQVIELDEDFKGSDQDMFTEDAAEQLVEVVEDSDVATLPEGEAVDMGAAAPLSGAIPRFGEQVAEEYSVWNVVALSMIIVVFLPTAVMMIDLMRNMWSWNSANALSSSMMDAVLSMFGG